MRENVRNNEGEGKCDEIEFSTSQESNCDSTTHNDMIVGAENIKGEKC
jgi:hypothetical protein